VIRYRSNFDSWRFPCTAVFDPNAVDPAIRNFDSWRFSCTAAVDPRAVNRLRFPTQ